jgi:hypothetical protein
MSFRKYLLVFVFLLLISFSFAQPKLSDEAKLYAQQILAANESIAKLQENNFSYVRYQDTLTLAQTFYSDQLTNEFNNVSADYSAVQQKLKELQEIESSAFLVSDELKALELTINQTPEINLSKVLEKYDLAKQAFVSERYEESLDLIDETYEEISTQEAAVTRVKALYDIASRSIGNYFRMYWWQITMVFLSFILFFIISYIPFMTFLTNEKIKKLELRSKSIYHLISESQRDYFEKKHLSESTYRIRMKKYSELLRDINRQIPLLREELILRKRMFFSLTKKERGKKYGKEN